MGERLWAWVPLGTEIWTEDGMIVARKSHRIKVYRVIDAGVHDHPLEMPCLASCATTGSAQVCWIDGKARRRVAKLDFIDQTDSRWFRGRTSTHELI
jgi:hypothetical protein